MQTHRPFISATVIGSHGATRPCSFTKQEHRSINTVSSLVTFIYTIISQELAILIKVARVVG